MKEDLSSLNWLFEPQYRWVRHLLFWGFIYIDPLLSLVGITDQLESGWRIWVLLIFPDLALVYFNLLVLIPKFLIKNRLVVYFLGTLLSLLIYGWVTFTLNYPFENWEAAGENSPLTAFLTEYVLDGIQPLGLAVAMKILIQYFQKQEEVRELENKNLATELAYLKNQINPHFLFNALNNIAVQSEKYPEKVNHSVVLLSRLLRHQLYEGEKEAVLLRDEIQHLKNFLELNVTNLKDTDLQFAVNGNTAGITVAPFLFLPFVENAAKHSRQANENAFIHLSFTIERERILFFIKNSKPRHRPTKIVGGIGLVNVRRRLELRYPQLHQLDITEDDTSFTVNLSLNYLV